MEKSPTKPPTAPSEEPEVPAEEAVVEAPEHPGVAVVRVPNPEQPGREDLQIVPLGNMDRLAIPSLLELAVKLDRRNLGLGDS